MEHTFTKVYDTTNKHSRCFWLFSSTVLVVSLNLMPNLAFAQTEESSYTASKLKKLSLEELMNVEVTSVSGQSEKLTEVASAIQVVTGEDIRRSSVLRLPGALRLASNIQIAQANSHDHSITARGFSGSPTSGGLLSNKLLAMIDGRSIYSPLFAGVYWDVQNVLLEDIDRIEVVSGPGGTLWGANAVNGVISIKTKSAKETQGLYVSEQIGSFLKEQTEMRYGSQIGEKLYFRFYGQRFDQKGRSSTDSANAYNMRQGGFRMDYYQSRSNTFTLQGDVYGGNEKDLTKYNTMTGQNILGRFSHTFSEKSNLNIQLYADHTTRKSPKARTPFNYELTTYDIDIQYRFPIGNRQSILIGAGYRNLEDKTNSTAIDPQNKSMPMVNGFIQDEITIAPDLLKLTVGSKFLNNVFTGFEIQPSARMAFTPNKSHTIWGAVSGAVRTPSRFDADIIIGKDKLAPDGFKSEKVTAYELGYRVRPIDKLSFSLATFYNQYTDLRSLNTATNTIKIKFANDQKAESFGFEISSNYHATDWWRLRSGYTYLNKKVTAVSSAVLPGSDGFEGVDPKNQFMLQSIMDLPKDFQFDFTGRAIGVLPSVAGTPGQKPTPRIPAYYTCDVRIAKQFSHIELSIMGKNLLAPQNIETGIYSIPRSVYAKVACRF